MTSKREEKLVSVIVPTFNSAKHLAVCLDSVKSQRYPAKETWVVDNFSGDGTATVARACGANVLFFRGTQGAARNVGVAKSKGQYVLFLDSDQRLEKGVLEECASICGGGVEAVKIPEVFVGLDFWGKCSALWKNNMVADSEAQSAIPRFYSRERLLGQPFAEKLRWWEDQELYQRLKAAGLKEAWCCGRVVHYEAESPSGTVRKYVAYGRAAKFAERGAAKSPAGMAFTFTFSALKRVLQNPRAEASVVFGCLFLFAVRSVSGVIGFLA